MAHTGQAMFCFLQPAAAEVDKQANTRNGEKAHTKIKEKESHYPPKSSKWIFSRSTPRLSSISRTALVIMGGPHMK